MKFSTQAVRIALVGTLAGAAFFPVLANALTLQEVIRDTLKNNPDIQAANKEVLAREHEIRQAKAGWLPTLDAEAGTGRERTISPSTGNEPVTLTRDELALRLRQTIYNGNATGNEVERQKARYKSALYRALEVQENTSLRAARFYLDVMRQAKLLSLLQTSLDEHKKIYDQVSDRNKAGVGSGADVDQISVRLSLATSNYIAGKNNFIDALSNFQGTVGYIPDVSTLKFPANLLLPADLDSALAIAVENHPTLKSSEVDIDAAEAQHRASKSLYFPTLTLEGDRTWNEDLDGTVGDNEEWLVALRLRYNLFNGGADSARRKQTAELLAQSKDVHKATLWQVEESMRLSWSAYESTEQQLGYLASHVEAVTDTKEAYIKQYEIGRRTLLDLLNTEGELLQANQIYTNTQYDRILAEFRVLNSAGILTKELGVK